MARVPNYQPVLGDDRLDRYEAMLESGGRFQRQDGSLRLERERVYLQGLIEMERKRRGNA